MGLVLEVHPADRVLARARAMARAFTDASPTALSLCKRALGRSLSCDAATMLAVEADAQGLAFSTEHARRALDGFLAKQPPAFRWPAA